MSDLKVYHRRFVASEDDERLFQATRAIVLMARRWRKAANDRIKPLGQTMARWEALFLVSFGGESLPQSELARLMSFEGPTMVRMLDALARDDLIERCQSEGDRRVTTNRITPEGHKAITDIMAITTVLRAELLSGIDRDQLVTFIDVTAQIMKRLDEVQ